MPEISRFYGIVIRMYFNDHNPPHFHAVYAGQEALIEIGTMGVLAGQLPPRAMGLVSEWASQHRVALTRNWQRARNAESLEKIDPLV